MKVGSLFAGIGGFDLAFQMEGFEIAWQCEKDPWCLDLLRKRWPGVPKIEDVFKVNTEEHEPVDIICGGFPCQPFSQAGKREGTEDDRHLWPEMLRVIRDFRPRWVIGENVYGLTVGEMAPVFDEVLSDLEAAGYSVRAFVLPACGVDAPHIRQRAWIVAYTQFAGPAVRESFEESRRKSNHEKRYGEEAKQQRFYEQLGFAWDATNAEKERRGETREYQLGGQAERISGVREYPNPTNSIEVGREKQRGTCRKVPESAEVERSTGRSGSLLSDATHPNEEGWRQNKAIASGSKKGSSCFVYNEPNDTNTPGRKKERPRQSRQEAGGTTGRVNEPSVLGMGDGLSNGLDEPRRWEDRHGVHPSPRIVETTDRSSRIGAIGNAVVADLVRVLVRAIKESELIHA